MTEEEVLLKNLSIYRNEIWSITSSILKLKEKIITSDAFIRCGDKDNFVIDHDPEPHEIITTILNNASRLQKLFIVANQRMNESDQEYQFRKERGEYLRKYFLPKKKGERELFKTSARNSIEHFDERTDVLMNKLIENDIELGERLILYNMTINYKDFFQPWDLALPIKVFVTESLEYFIVNERLEKEFVSLKMIFAESEKIHEKVKEYVQSNFKEGAPERNGPIGIWIPINEKK